MKRTDRVAIAIMLGSALVGVFGFLLFAIAIEYFEVGYELLMRDD